MAWRLRGVLSTLTVAVKFSATVPSFDATIVMDTDCLAMGSIGETERLVRATS